MPDYPIEPAKLLDAADLLTPQAAERGRPPYTANRRAVSTAYYAVFHAISERVVDVVFVGADQEFKWRVRRWVDHGDIRTVANWVGRLDGSIRGQQAPAHIVELSFAPDRLTTEIAAGFRTLLDAREEADYNHLATFSRPATLDLIALAREVVATVQSANSDQVLTFFGLIAMQSNIRAR